MPSRSKASFTSLLLLTAYLARLTTAHPSSSSSKSQSNPRIKWSNCSIADAPQLSCGSIDVPMDYSGRTQGTVNLVLTRLPASKPSQRLGSLIYNPGGPGYGGLELLEAAAQGIPLFSKELLSRYDFILFDPRGTGQSSPVKCDPSIANRRISYFPTDQKSYEQLVAYNQAFGKSCASLTGPLINFLDTTSVAQDLEVVRQALTSEYPSSSNNNDKLNFFGQSYGSQIGLQYAELYPQNIGRMALDGILDHTQSETDTLITESSTYERVLGEFFKTCTANTSCPLYGKDIPAIWKSLTATDRAPIPAPGCITTGECRTDVTPEELRGNAQGYLLFQNLTSEVLSGWDVLAQGLAEAYLQNNATILSTYLATSNTSEYFSSLAIGCQDWSHTSTSLVDLRVKNRMTAALNPQTKGSTQSYLYQAGCIGWPTKTTNPQKMLNNKAVEKAPPILLVQSTIDPSCSVVWSVDIRDQMGGKGVLLLREGAGHTSYHQMGEASKAIDRFLIDGKLPGDGAVVSS